MVEPPIQRQYQISEFPSSHILQKVSGSWPLGVGRNVAGDTKYFREWNIFDSFIAKKVDDKEAFRNLVDKPEHLSG